LTRSRDFFNPYFIPSQKQLTCRLKSIWVTHIDDEISFFLRTCLTSPFRYERQSDSSKKVFSTTKEPSRGLLGVMNHLFCRTLLTCNRMRLVRQVLKRGSSTKQGGGAMRLFKRHVLHCLLLSAFFSAYTYLACRGSCYFFQCWLVLEFLPVQCRTLSYCQCTRLRRHRIRWLVKQGSTGLCCLESIFHYPHQLHKELNKLEAQSRELALIGT